MATVNSTSDIFVMGPQMVIHSSDIQVETHRGYFFNSVVQPWSQETIDSSKDWDQIYPAVRGSYASDAHQDIGGMAYIARSGNYFSPEWLKLDQGASQSWDHMWFRGPLYWGVHEYIGDPETDSSPYQYAWNESLGNPWWSWAENYEVFTDSSDEMWNISRDGTFRVSVNKLDTDTNGFVQKNTRSATTWSTHDPRGILNWKTFQKGDVLHVVFVDANTSAAGYQVFRSLYSTFNMATEAWVIEDEVIYDPATDEDPYSPYELACGIAVRSTGEVVAYVPTERLTYGTLSRNRMGYTRRLGTDSWATLTVLYPAATDAYFVFDEHAQCILGASDRVHFFAQSYDAAGSPFTTHLWHRSLSSTNVLDTEVVLSHRFSLSDDGQGYAPSVTAVHDTDTYIYMGSHQYLTSNGSRHSIIFIIKSEASPTITRQDNPDTGYFDDRRVDTGTYEGGTAGFFFVDADGLVNFVRGEQDTYATVVEKWHYVEDGRGGVIYTQEDPPTGVFGKIRQRFGAYLEPTGETVHSGTNRYNVHNAAEWAWPFIGEYGFTNGNYFEIDGTEYVGVMGRGISPSTYQETAGSLMLFELDPLPVITVTHTSDIVKRPKPISNVSDIVTVAPGSSPVVDHFSDIVTVDRATVWGYSDIVAVEHVTVENYSDIVMSGEVVLTVSMTTVYTLSPGIELLLVPPLGGELIGRSVYIPLRKFRRTK